MTKRDFLRTSTAIGLCLSFPKAWAADKYGADLGYPTGWGGPGRPPRWESYPEYRVGNYAGGFEQMFPHHRIRAGSETTPWKEATARIRYRVRSSVREPGDYLSEWPVTSLLIARDGNILYESYRMGRNASMRMTSWSMAKSVTSLLLGIALDRGLVRSLDDLPQDYVPALQGTLHGGVPLRHLMNMSSGADVVHERDPVRIDVPAFLGNPEARGLGTHLERVVQNWNARLEAPGARFNYNELCPLTIGMVLRNASGMTLTEFAEKFLWQPMGAEADATWLTDAQGKEYNCVGVAARARDWARLGQLVAQRGLVQNRQVVSARWIDECATWGPLDRQVSWGSVRADMGYKNFFWHPKRDGTWMVMNGHHGQRVLIDRTSRTVLVQTAVNHEGPWQQELFSLFEAAIQA